MKKYWLVARITWDETLSYRLNFIMWRIRTVFQLLTIYFLWLSILPKNNAFLGYTKPIMLTYILGTALVGSIVLSSRSYSVGEEINNGNLLNFLIRPINYFMYWFAKDVGDKAMNITFSAVELTIIFIILRPPFFIQTNLFSLVLFLTSIVLALILYFYLNFFLGLIGFWSPEVWAPRFIFITLLSFFAGSLFPLDILPKPIFSILQASPFPYLLYFPLKIYLGKLPIEQIYFGILTSLLWTIIMYFAVRIIFARGLKAYTAFGR